MELLRKMHAADAPKKQRGSTCVGPGPQFVQSSSFAWYCPTSWSCTLGGTAW